MKLHELSVRRPVCVSMIVLIFVIIGGYALTMLPMELMPEMDMPMAIVMTNYNNVGAKEVESMVTETIENACASVSGIDTITSQTMEGRSLMMLQFHTGTDMDKAVSDVEDSIDMISGYLPEECDDPMVIKLDMNQSTVAMLSVGYEGYDLIQTKKFIEDNVKSELESVKGVASVSVMGAQDRIIEIEVDPEKLHGYGLAASDIKNAVAMQNVKLPAGSTTGMNKNLSVRVIGEFKELSDIECVPVTTKNGQTIYISDIADVKDTFSDNSSFSRLNGDDAISITISAESDANAVDVVNGIKNSLKKLSAEYPKFVYDIPIETGSTIENAVKSVAESAIIGALLAIIVLLLFLGNIRSSLVIGVAMPVSVITTFMGMFFMNMTLNVVSLGGLALGVGMLVDNAVVVIENITRRRNEFGDDSKASAVSGTAEVIGAVVASVITTCIVYVPIMFVDNMMAEMFKQLAFTIIVSQISSLIITFLLIPMLSSRIKNMDERSKSLSFVLVPFDKLLNRTYKLYNKGLRYVLTHRKRIVVIVLVLFGASIASMLLRGMELMPSSDEGMISVTVELPVGSVIEDTNKISKIAEEKIKDIPEIETIMTSVGSMGFASLTSGVNTASVSVMLRDDRKKTTDEMINEIRSKLTDLPGANVKVAASSSGMSTSTNTVSFRYTAKDEEMLEAFVLKAEEILKTVEGVAETSTSISQTQPELVIDIDESKAAKYGMATASVASHIGAVLDGTTASRYTDGGSEYDIKIVYPDSYITDYSQLKNLQIKTPLGQWIMLSDVADISVEQSSATLTRVDQKRVITLSGVIDGSDIGGVNRRFMQAMKDVDMPEGISQQATGAYEMMVEAMIQFIGAIILGIILMYMVMAAQFESLKEPFLILFTIPLSIIGVAFSLIITGSNLSVLSFIGMLMLIGIIVNNGILLIEFIKQKRVESPELSRNEAVIAAAITRLRPICMTTITTVFGFIPMVFGGAEQMRPLALVLLGGLSVGAVLTLFFIPLLYTVMDDKDIKKKMRRAKKRTVVNN